MATVELQDNDLAQIAAFINDAEVDVELLSSTEGISELYSCTIEFTLRTADVRLAMKDVIGTAACVGIRSRVSNSSVWEERYIHGVISRLRYMGELLDPNSTSTKSRYSATIVPPLWFLTQNRKCRIFQGDSIPDILSTVLGEYSISYSFGDAEGAALRGVYPPLEYCVQYNESDYDFVARLMEQCGISYFFKHTKSEATLYLSDSTTPYYFYHDDDNAQSTLTFGNLSTGTTGDHIGAWSHDCEFRPQSYAHGDFNYENANADMRSLARASTLNFPGHHYDHEVYEYPGVFTDSGGTGSSSEDLKYGENLANRRIEEQEGLHEVIEGNGRSIVFAPGAKFNLTGHPVAEENANWVVRRIHYTSAPDDGHTLPSGTAVFASFECLPADTIFRPPRQTPRPIVRGPQTAIVTNAAGAIENSADSGSKADVNTDAKGRVQIRFHWDVTDDADSSCWVRVSQDWAGNGYGSLMIPHVGHEVVVSFLEGNPDRPLITGRVYNSQNQPPGYSNDNGVATNPNRAIVAQDEVGNKIILDADEKRVDIQNASDKMELTVGTSATATAGLNFEVTLGLGASINLGAAVTAELAASYGLQFGWSTSVFAGGTWSASFGADFTYAKGRYVNAGDSLGQISFTEGADFISKERASLVGGSTVNNSLVKADSDALTLSYGPVHASMAADYSMGWAMFGLGVAGSIGAAAAGATAFLGATAADKGEFDGHAAGALATGTASAVASIAAYALLRKYATECTAIQQPVHAVPVAQMQLNAQGAVLSSSAMVIHQAGTTMHNIATESFAVVSPEATVSGNLSVVGQFSSTNIRDLGDPAAAAAALAECQAQIAAWQADAAADAAAEEGARAADQVAAAAQEEGAGA